MAVVIGPPHEGNAVEVLRWLDANYDGRVVWLLESGKVPQRQAVDRLLVSDGRAARAEIWSRRSIHALWLFLRAELVLFTSVWYGGPHLRGRRLAVNVWHGDGPKTTGYPGFVSDTPADVTVAGTAVWGKVKAEAFGGQLTDLVVSGNPRIDQYDRPVGDGELRVLGLDPSCILVLWAPTFRVARNGLGGIPADHDAERNFVESLSELESGLRSMAGLNRIQIVVKPHPLERVAFDQILPWVKVLRDDDLLGAGVGFYQLIGRMTALITDYSSIWTDFLPLDRPIGLFCPDLEEYAAGRGFSTPDFEAYAPGPILRNAEELQRFLELAVHDATVGAESRRAVAGRLGAVVEIGATARLMIEVSRRLKEKRCEQAT